MEQVYKHLSLLGCKVSDKVTGFTGVVTSVGFDLYGCIQAIVHPGLDETGKVKEQNWFDINRLVKTSDPVMEVPDFVKGSVADGRKGPAEKPSFSKA